MTAPSASKVERAKTIALTLYLKDMEPLEFLCAEDNPVITTLFIALQNRHRAPDDTLYLNIGGNDGGVLYLRQSQLLALKTSPPVDPGSIPIPSGPESGKITSRQTQFDDEWKTWIWHNISRGCSKESVLKVLVEKGFDHDESCRELNMVSGTSVAESPNEQSLFIPNAKRLNSQKAEIYTLDGFLSEEECNRIIQIMRDRLQPSTTVAGERTREFRTSRTCFFNNHDDLDPLIDQVDQRICKLLGINPTYRESLQGHFYDLGEEYKPHHDWFMPDTKDFEVHANPERGGQRTWTFMVYLNDAKKGGGTYFPRLDRLFTPKCGTAIIWNNLYPSGNPNPDVLHHALPVEAGDKAVLTQWFRSIGDGPMFIRDTQEDIPNHTVPGFNRTRIPEDLFSLLTVFYRENANEPAEGELLKNEEGSDRPGEVIELPSHLRKLVGSALLPICERWSGKRLESTGVYGIRRYHRDAAVTMHRDSPDAHITAVITIAERLDRTWPFELEDNYYRTHLLTLEPGEMVLFEGARNLHGRPTPLAGDYSCTVFARFRPVV